MSKERLTTEEIQQEIRKVLQSVALNGYDLVCAESDIIKASEAFAAQEVEAAIAERMPTKVDVIKLLKGYSWEYQEIFKDGCDWFRSRMEEKK